MENILGYGDRYKIDIHGNIYNSFGRKLAPFKCNSGYLMVTLCFDGKKDRIMIHRVMAKTYIDNPNEKPQVNHKDGNKINNHIANLEWVTQSENMKHSCNVLGNKKPPQNWLGKFGSNHNRSKKIYEYSLDGKLLNEYESGLDFKRKTGVCNTSASWAIKHNKPIYGKLYSFELKDWKKYVGLA